MKYNMTIVFLMFMELQEMERYKVPVVMIMIIQMEQQNNDISRGPIMFIIQPYNLLRFQIQLLRYFLMHFMLVKH